MSCDIIFTPIPNTCTVPCTRVLTINGVSYDLSEDRSWTVSGSGGTLQDVTTLGNSTDQGIVCYVNTGIVGLTIQQVSGGSNLSEWQDGTGTAQVYIDNTIQFAFNVASGPIYFGNFANPTGSFAGFSVPGTVIVGLDASTLRLGIGGSTTHFANTSPNALLEVRGKANEIQNIVQGHSTQTENLQEYRNYLETVLSGVDKDGKFFLNGTTSGTVKVKANPTTTSWELQLPANAGTSGYVLQTDGSGNTSWVSAGSGSGTVTSVATAGLISGGTITTTGTITTLMNTNKLVGRSTAGTGIMEEITVGSGLTLSGGTLTNTATPTPLGYYGAWEDDNTQTAAANNTGYAMKFHTANITPSGVSIVNNGSGDPTRITFANTGVYNIQFSSQFQNVSNQLQDVTIWLRMNGTDIAGSSGFVSIPNSHGNVPGHNIAAWNYVLNVVAGQYYELIWSTTDYTSVTMQYYAAGSPPPAAASVILTVTQQSGIMAGTGITAINSLTGSAQTMVTGTSGTDFGISSTGTLHTFNLPTASSTNRGALSSTDWTTFNNKQASGNYITGLTGDVTASGPGSVAATIANNAVTYAKMQAISATSKLLGSSSTTTSVQEITLGTGLSMSGTTLSATGLGCSLGITLSGSGGTITTGSKGYLRMPRAGTITSWTVVGDQASGSIVIDVKRSTYAGFPTTTSIAGTNLPTISSAQKATDSTLTGWGSTSLAQDDIIEFVVNSCTAFTFVTLSISYS